MTSWFARRGFAVRTFMLVAAAVALVGATYVLFPRTAEGSYSRELVIAGLGAVVTVMAAVGVAALSLWREIRARRESAVLRRFGDETWRFNAIRAGRMEIPQITVVASCERHREWTDRVDVTFEDAPRRTAAPLREALYVHRLPGIREEAERRGVPLTDGECVDLVGASVRLSHSESGVRRRSYLLRSATSTYFDFVTMSGALDAPLPDAVDGTRSLRQAWGAFPTSIEDVSSLPAIAKVGVGTAVVTSDNRLVLGSRGRTYVAGQQDRADGRSLVHVVAEGMLPADRDTRGRLDPRETARRGVLEELNIGGTTAAYGYVTELRATGFFFDQLRWQPCFAYLARVNLTWDELQTIAPAAPDYWEVERLLSLPLNVHEAGIRHLLTGTHPDLALASNHAAAVTWFALLYEHGIAEMRNVLSGPGSVYVAQP